MGKGGGSKSGVGRKGMQAAAGMLEGTTVPRNMMFRQLASALATGGGKGFKMPFVQQAMARSRAAGQQALAGARDTLGGVDANIRGRFINRLMRSNQQATANIGPEVASQMIASAPKAVIGGGETAAEAFKIGAAGEAAAQQAAATRAAGFSSLVAGLASGGGSAAGGLTSMRGGFNPRSAAPGASLNPDVLAARSAAYDRMAASRGGGGWFDRFRIGGR